jgi:hypothetical protein
MPASARYVGIDLGTTNSTAAVFDGDQVTLVRSGQGSTLTPSVVGIDPDGQLVVGAAAKSLVNAPLQQFVEQQQIAQGEQQAMEMLGEIAARDGEFDKPMAWTVAQHIAATRGAPSNDRESQQLLADAARQVREYEKRIGEAYHQQQIEQIQTVAGAPRGLPAQVNGAQTVSAGGYGNVPGAVERRFFGG